MTRLPFDVGPVSREDSTFVVEFVNEAKRAAQSFRGHEMLQAIFDRIEVGSAQGRMGRLNSQPSGLVLWSHGERILTIDVLYVRPEFRGIGLGERLVLEAIRFAKEMSCSQIVARALPGDRETKNVFERTGLVSQLLVVGKRLD